MNSKRRQPTPVRRVRHLVETAGAAPAQSGKLSVGLGGRVMPGKLPLFLGRDYFQNAWVVDDLQAAMRRWTKTCGIGPFFLLEHVAMQDVTYRGQPATVDCSIALAQAGRTQIELIEQHCDQPSVYRDLVPRGQTRFHHVATFAHDYDRELAEYRARGLRVTTTGRFGEMRFAYIDATPEIDCVI